MSRQNAHILYVEDDRTLSFIIKDNLEREGYKITNCEDGQTALKIFTSKSFDLCIFDVMLPKLDGFTLASEVRKMNQEIPIIFLTAKSLHEDKIKGLKLGADDYIVKPFSIEELVLKIEVFLKRSKFPSHPEHGIVSIGQYKFDHKNYRLFFEESTISLTYKESSLLFFLYERKNTLVGKEQILIALWGENDYFLGRSLDVFISKLRKYLKKDPTIKIENRHGVGFILKVIE